ncbi:MAG: FAD-dependent monooxygenase [Planctomycetota bacterium]|nr:FAD-dependent monooxygenase [Planctomycetota bacterium]
MKDAPDKPHATWRVLGLEQGVAEPEPRFLERAAREIGAEPAQVLGARIARKALDARRRGGVHRLRFVAHVDVTTPASFRSARLSRGLEARRVQPAPAAATGRASRIDPSVARARVAVVGSGPGGLFAAWILARHGIRVTLVDRGSPIERRGRELVAFHRTRTPNPESNLLFGEGGAGTYSDGKLYTRVDDPLEETLLEELVACGADPSLVYDARAHIGTDRLHRILPRFRARLEAAGVQFVWNARVERLVLASPGRVRALETTVGEIACDAVVFAPGHSARDTWTALHEQGVVFESKPFQVGVRIEHPQELVDRAQHGLGPEATLLGPASYALVARAAEGVVGAHSFCMCPGGRIVASVNEPGFLCTNGMSNSTHSSRWANAAIVATVGTREFGPGPFAGVAFQRGLERRFFEAGGGDYHAPAQRAADFLARRVSGGELRSSYVLGLVPGRVDELLPPILFDAIAAALARFERTIPGFSGPEGLLVGLESRSSGPVRMPRDEVNRRARDFANLFPVGEGAGYAGGIMSAALDGARTALALLENGIG